MARDSLRRAMPVAPDNDRQLAALRYCEATCTGLTAKPPCGGTKMLRRNAI